MLAIPEETEPRPPDDPIQELLAKLERNARFYRNEATALAEKPERRDNRQLGAREAAAIAELLEEAGKTIECYYRSV